MKLLAIDPGSNKCGLAFFEGSTLKGTKTLITKDLTPLTRRLDIFLQLMPYFQDDIVTVSEEPLLLGRNNNGMQRLLGMIEYGDPEVHFIHPMTVKKAVGSGTLDKLEVAFAIGERLKTSEEQEMIADAIDREAFDETDAVAIGLTYLEQKNVQQLEQ